MADNIAILDGAGASKTIKARDRSSIWTPTHLNEPYGTAYETVAASQTAQVLGATGATGDFIQRVIIIPTTTGAGSVALLDNAISITIYNTGTLVDLKPFTVELGLYSVSGAWKITTGANVAAIGVGYFT